MAAPTLTPWTSLGSIIIAIALSTLELTFPFDRDMEETPNLFTIGRKGGYQVGKELFFPTLEGGCSYSSPYPLFQTIGLDANPFLRRFSMDSLRSSEPSF